MPAPVPPNVIVGATIVKRFPGYGEHRGTIAEIDLDAGKVVVRWATDERTTPAREAAKRALYAIPPTEEEEDDRSIGGSTTVAYDSGDETVDYEGGARTSSRFWGVNWNRRDKKWMRTTEMRTASSTPSATSTTTRRPPRATKLSRRRPRRPAQNERGRRDRRAGTACAADEQAARPLRRRRAGRGARADGDDGVKFLGRDLESKGRWRALQRRGRQETPHRLLRHAGGGRARRPAAIAGLEGAAARPGRRRAAGGRVAVRAVRGGASAAATSPPPPPSTRATARARRRRHHKYTYYTNTPKENQTALRLVVQHEHERRRDRADVVRHATAKKPPTPSF